MVLEVDKTSEGVDIGDMLGDGAGDGILVGLDGRARDLVLGILKELGSKELVDSNKVKQTSKEPG